MFKIIHNALRLLKLATCAGWCLLASSVYAAEDMHYEDAEYLDERVATIQFASLREASGLAMSYRTPGVFWSHNDSGHRPYLYAFSAAGKLLGTYLLGGAHARDWEDMASFSINDEPWLVMGDVGDNDAKYPHSTLYLLREPELPKNSPHKVRSVDDLTVIKFAFPDGPADCESIAVDTQEQRIYLLTKRQKPPRLYSIPLMLEQSSNEPLIAKFEGAVKLFPKPTIQEIIDFPKIGPYRGQPTAMDFAPDLSFAVVGTYGHSYRFERAAGQSWINALRSSAHRIHVPVMAQSEALAIGLHSENIYYTSEGKYPPLFKLAPLPKTHEE